MAYSYASTDDLKRYLRSNQSKITVGNESTDDLTLMELSLFIEDQAKILDEQKSAEGFTLSEETCRYIVIRWTAYEVYRSLYPRASVNEIPLAVQGWKKDADDKLAEMKGSKKLTPGALGAGW